jgi:RNase adapter protein RapZ
MGVVARWLRCGLSRNNRLVAEPAPEDTVPGKPLRLVVVTGMSGAGRSTAAHSLEDLGWYVIDNLPPSLLVEVCEQARQINLTRVAVVLDVRTREFF